MSTTTYNPDEVSILVGVILVEDGYADGEFLTIENNEDAYAIVVSTDGAVTRSKTNNNTATVTLKLMQSSGSNAALSALHNLDKSTPNGAGIVPILVRDRSGDSIYEADECWIRKAPDVSFDRQGTPREWVIEVGNLRRLDAGN